MITLEKFISDCENISKKIETLNPERNIVIDGVINTERYFNLKKDEKPRLLWLLKEANSDESWSYLEKFKDRKWLNQCNGLSSIRRIIYTSYGILYGGNKEWAEFPWSYEQESIEVLSDIAFVNIKKEPGGNTSDDYEIAEAYQKNRDILKMQIDIYDPDIVIFGNTMQYVNTADFPGLNDTEKKVSNYHNHYYYGDTKLYINTWHPACRGKGFTDSGYVMDIVQICRDWKKQSNI